MKRGRESSPHIGIFGRRNFGKSSLINVLAGQDIAIVSDHPGTTTDPVKKTFEITGYGPVVLIDTAGIDDTGKLGKKRVDKSFAFIETVDLGLLLVTYRCWEEIEDRIVSRFIENDVPYLIIYNKSDISVPDEEYREKVRRATGKDIFLFSAINPAGSDNLIRLIKNSVPENILGTPTLLGDIISYGDIVLLITPVDIEAPEGRLILPQVQAIRDIIDNDAIAVVLKEREVDAFLRNTGIKPALAITDSQIFVKADASIPAEIPLTSFSIALARMKGSFDSYLKGTPHISRLKDGDKILLLESCTHHVSCDDIGRVKIPRWISNFSGKHLDFESVAGLDTIKNPVTSYALIIQCGGCMITRKQLQNRLRPAIMAGVPVTNYGMAIAYVQGIYRRAIAPFTSSLGDHDDYL